MDINRENLELFFQEMKVEYTAGFNAGKEESILKQAAMTVPSTGSSVVHAWLNQIPQMREWVGDRIANNIESNSMTITNKKYESTIEIKREDIEDDQHGLYRPLATLMGKNAATNPDKLLGEVLVADDNWGGDDAAFFGTTRTYGDNTISNSTTGALSADNFNTAIQTMGSYLGHNNETLGVDAFALLYGPSNRTTAFDILKNDFVAGNSVQIQNVNKNLVMPIETKRFVGDYANYWCVLGEIGGIRGIVYQDRLPAEFQTSRMNDDSDFVFETDKYQMGARARGRAFLSLPHLIYRGTGAA